MALGICSQPRNDSVELVGVRKGNDEFALVSSTDTNCYGRRQGIGQLFFEPRYVARFVFSRSSGAVLTRRAAHDQLFGLTHR